jgi:hypothetical protein
MLDGQAGDERPAPRAQGYRCPTGIAGYLLVTLFA